MEKSARVIDGPSFNVLIAAAGSGTRLQSDIPKQYQKINGKMILRRSIEAFLACPGLQELKVIIDPGHETLYRQAIEGLSLPGPVPGGADRQKSVANGLKAFSHLKENDILLIHDAARPLVSRDNIMEVVRAVDKEQAATLALPVADTMRHEDGGMVDRKGIWAVQTPQGFRYGLIKQAHEQEDQGAHTDDASMVSALGKSVKLVHGSRRNFKITTPDDLALARSLMGNKMTRTGFGFDVHAFTDGNAVRLCGIDVPFNKSLAGHSDADVGLHALTDALLGAVAAGDIGQHFPPSDPKWKGADSALFLAQAVNIVGEKGGSIVNLDLTLICEAPKIGPHREAMQKRVAEICGLSPDQVGIKATTTEQLGFTGRGEGIAAQAVATIAMDQSDV